MEKVIEKYLNKWVEIDLNSLPMDDIAIEMSDPNQDKNEEWKTWFPIDSKVTEEEIKDYGKVIGYKFPKTYKRFLKYKHFYELHIYQYSFCSHPIKTWRDSLTQFIYDGYPTEFLIDKGKIPFASWSDWGVLSFDTENSIENNEYPVLLQDHEDALTFVKKYENFEKMIYELDKIEQQNNG